MDTIDKLVTDNIDIWTSSIEQRSTRGRGSSSKIKLHGINKLRELILELAIRGLLVAQNSSDKPANKLLKEIDKEKKQLVSLKVFKKKPELPIISDMEIPFSIPYGWEWARLDHLAPMSLFDGDWIESKDQDLNGNIRLIQLADIGVGDFKNISRKFINESSYKRLKCTKLRKGDVLIARLPNPIGRACIFPGLNQLAITAVDVAILRLLDFCYDRYIVHSLNSLTTLKQVKSYGKGATRFRISTGNLKTILIPIPPLTEQHRIVAKVDELMALCDQLEQQQTDSIDAHQTLVENLLNGLIESAKSTTPIDGKYKNTSDYFNQLIANHFDTLFTTEHSIDTLKQTILQLAVMGKLVPQDPSDEPASILLEKITEEKKRLLQEGKTKKQKALPEIIENEKSYFVPDGWEWCRLQDITNLITDGKHGDCNNLLNSGYYFLSAKDIQNGKLLYDKARQIDPNEFQEVHQRTNLEPGNICMVNTGATVGKMAIATDHKNTFNTTFQKSVAVIKVTRPYISQYYIANFLTAETPSLLKRSGGSAINNLLLGDLKKHLVPLPPLREQIAIVNKIQKLMALCDKLKSEISISQTTQIHLADAIIEQAIK